MRLEKQLRLKEEEFVETSENLKIITTQKEDLHAKLQALDESYKRDSALFRQEALKHDEESEKARLKHEKDLSKTKMSHQQTLDFVHSVKKEIGKLGGNIEKKICSLTPND